MGYDAATTDGVVEGFTRWESACGCGGGRKQVIKRSVQPVQACNRLLTLRSCALGAEAAARTALPLGPGVLGELHFLL